MFYHAAVHCCACACLTLLSTMDIVNTDHLVFQNNPLQLKSFIDKYVEVTTITGDKLQGKIYTIDPVSETVVLLSRAARQDCEEPSLTVDMIMGHSLKSVDLIQLPDSGFEIPDGFFNYLSNNEYSREEIVSRRNSVKDWLCKNRIPVEEDGEVLRVINALEILPPYDVKSCSSLDGNEIILERVQNLLASIQSVPAK